MHVSGVLQVAVIQAIIIIIHVTHQRAALSEERGPLQRACMGHLQRACMGHLQMHGSSESMDDDRESPPHSGSIREAVAIYRGDGPQSRDQRGDNGRRDPISIKFLAQDLFVLWGV